jgi:hypothetical protein
MATFEHFFLQKISKAKTGEASEDFVYISSQKFPCVWGGTGGGSVNMYG